YGGGGTDGTRVQLLYVYAADKPNRYSTYAGSFQTWAAAMDAMVNGSAQETNGIRHIRVLTDSNCKPVVTAVQVSATGDDTFDNTVSELRAKGYDLDNRKYLAWVDANVYCGLGERYSDDSPNTSSYTNLNDGAAGIGGMFARVDTSCWN